VKHFDPSFSSEIRTIPDGIEVSIPPRRNYLIVAVLGMAILITLWTLYRIETGQDRFDWPVLVGFVFCFGALALLVRNFTGLETIVLAHDALTIRRAGLGYASEHRYAVHMIRALRVDEDRRHEVMGFKTNAPPPTGLGAGPFAFEYGARRIRFGNDMTLDEAQYVLQQMSAANPALAGKTA
jgi:hypothetical protein